MGFSLKEAVGKVIDHVIKPVVSTVVAHPLETILGSHGMLTGTALSGLAVGTAASPVAIASGLFVLAGEVKRVATVGEALERRIGASTQEITSRLDQLMATAQDVRNDIGLIAQSATSIARSVEDVSRSLSRISSTLLDANKEIHSVHQTLKSGIAHIETLILSSRDDVIRAIKEETYQTARASATAAIFDLSALEGANSLPPGQFYERLWNIQRTLNGSMFVMLDSRKPFDTTAFIDISYLYLAWAGAYEPLAAAGHAGSKLDHPLTNKVAASIDRYLSELESVHESLSHKFSVLPAAETCFDAVSGAPVSMSYAGSGYSPLDKSLRPLLSPASQAALRRLDEDPIVRFRSDLLNMPSDLRFVDSGNYFEEWRARREAEEDAAAKRALAGLSDRERATLAADFKLLTMRIRSHRIVGDSLESRKLISGDGRLRWEHASSQALEELGIKHEDRLAAIDMVSVAGNVRGLRETVLAALGEPIR